MDDEDKSTIYDKLKSTGFYSMRHNKGRNSARRKDALYNLPKAIARTQNRLLPPIERIEDVSDKLEGQGIEKSIIPSNKIDI